MQEYFKKVAEFQTASDQTVNTTPSFIPNQEARLRMNLAIEEATETLDGNVELNKTEILDGLVDQLYIWLGTVNAHGMQGLIPEAFNRVHSNNMTKVVDGKVLRREDGKIIKPEGYVSVDLSDMIN